MANPLSSYGVSDRDYAAAIAEYEKLPENVQAAAGAFIEKVRSRLAVERLLDQAVAGAMKA